MTHLCFCTEILTIYLSNRSSSSLTFSLIENGTGFALTNFGTAFGFSVNLAVRCFKSPKPVEKSALCFTMRLCTVCVPLLGLGEC